MSTVALSEDKITELVESILFPPQRLDPLEPKEIICPRSGRTPDQRSKERARREHHVTTSRKMNRAKKTRLSARDARKLRLGTLDPRALHNKSLTSAQRAQAAVLPCNDGLTVHESIAGIDAVEETPRVPIGKLLNDLGIQGSRFVMSVIDGTTVFLLDGIAIYPAA